MLRYDLLLKEIDIRKPSTIVEIGTWRGINAAKMIERANRYKPVKYIGFDLFEDLTADIKTEEFNGKAYTSLNEAKTNISRLTQNYDLVKGNTKDTIPIYIFPEIDFLYIDGGHSFETIESDWNNTKQYLNKDSIVIFDDYYIGPLDKQYGCQKLLKSLGNNYNFKLLEPFDRLNTENLVHLAKVTLKNG